MKSLIPITYIFLIFFITCTAVLAKTDEEKNKLPMITNSPSNPETYGEYFKAIFDTKEGKFDEAQNKFNKINSPSAPAIIRRGHIRLLSDTKQYKKILEQLSLLDEDSANDPELQIKIIEALIRTNQKQKGVERLLDAIDKFPGHQGIAMLAVQWYLDGRNPESALLVIERYLSDAPSKSNNYLFYFIKAQILTFQNQFDRALEAAKESIAAYRNFEKGWLLYAQLEEHLGNIDTAIKGYKTFLDIVGQEPTVQNHLLELLFKQKMLKEHKTMLSIPMSCLQKAQLLFEQNQPTEALKLIEECLKKEPTNSAAALMKIQILESLGEIQRAFNLAVQLMNAQPNDERWYKKVSSLQKKGIKRHEIVNAFATVEKKNLHSIVPVQYLADLYLRTKNQQQSLVYLQKVIDLAKDNQLKAKAHYQKACIFHQQHNTQEMVKELEAGRASFANFAPINNMLSYYYAAKGKNQTKALELINQALASEPTNPHYLDTMAYISYKQGDCKKALKIIEPLASRVPDDTVIENHLRKIQQGFSIK